MYEPEEKITKYKSEVQVQLDDGASLLGFVFLKQVQRVSDLLNDSRQFLPFQKSDGAMIYIRKATIANVVELKQQDERNAPSDPYEILGVSRSISDEDLKRAYRDLCNHYHPDRVRPLDLPADLSDLASSRLIKIIDAYRRITNMRHGRPGNGQKDDSPFTRV